MEHCFDVTCDNMSSLSKSRHHSQQSVVKVTSLEDLTVRWGVGVHGGAEQSNGTRTLSHL